MAALTWFLTSSLNGASQQGLSETDPGAEGYASPVYGWIVGTTAGGNFSSADAQTEAAAATFGATAQPDGTPVTTAGAGDCWVTASTYSGTFDTGNWTIDQCIRANTSAGGTSRGRARVFRTANQDGSSATEVTAAVMVGSTVTPSTSSTTDSTVTASINTFSVTNEYILIQIGWETVTAGGMTTNDVNYRVGNGSGAGTRVTSANFTSTATPSWGPLIMGKINQPVFNY